MAIIRRIGWTLLFAVIVAIFVMNWDKPKVDFVFWPGLVWDTKLPMPLLLAFLLGLLPAWLLHRTTHWRLTRRIRSLEKALRDAAAALAPQSPDTQLQQDDPSQPSNNEAK